MSGRIPDEIRQQVISLYEQGIKLNDIAIACSIHKDSVLKIARAADLTKRLNFKRVDKETSELIIASYKSGVEVLQIAKDFDIDGSTVYNILKRSNIELRRGNKSANLRVFAKPANGYTEFQKYWAGFLLADGCICQPKQGNPMLILGLQDRDKDHVLKFAEFLGATHAVRWNSRSTQWMIHVRGAYWIDDLAPFGITPQKTHTACIPQEFKRDRHFWRGLIDGDGSVRWHKTQDGKFANVSITGTLSICEDFCHLIECLTKNHFKAIRRNSEHNWSSWAYAQKAKVLVYWLYSNSQICLDRKQIIANEIISNLLESEA